MKSFVFAVLSLFCFNLMPMRQDTVDCASNGSANHARTNASILFVRMTDALNEEIWRYSLANAQASPFVTQLPSRIYPIDLSPDGQMLAYSRLNSINLHPQLYIQTVTGELLFKSRMNAYEEMIDPHWISEDQVGFKSGVNEYVIVDVPSKTYRAYRFPVPPNIEFRNLLITFNHSFTYAAVINEYSQDPIQFWDLNSGTKLNLNTHIAGSQVFLSRVIEWSNHQDDTFFIMNDERNWLRLSLRNDTLQQITDVGHEYKLFLPQMTKDGEFIVFLASSPELDRYDQAIGVWHNHGLVILCNLSSSEQVIMTDEGWNATERQYAFTVYDYVADLSKIYLIDLDSMSVSTLVTEAASYPGIRKILGWMMD